MADAQTTAWPLGVAPTMSSRDVRLEVALLGPMCKELGIPWSKAANDRPSPNDRSELVAEVRGVA